MDRRLRTPNYIRRPQGLLLDHPIKIVITVRVFKDMHYFNERSELRYRPQLLLHLCRSHATVRPQWPVMLAGRNAH